MTTIATRHATHPWAFALDPADQDGLEAYLRARLWITPWARVQRVERAGDGNMNLTLRVVTPTGSLIVKQGRPWVEKYPSIAGGPAARWLVGPARAWLQVWRDVFAVDGFNPFDTLAVAAVATPQFVTCEMLPAAIVLGPDDGTEARMQGTSPVEKPYLTVASDVGSERRVRYCSGVAPEFKDHLIEAVRGLAPDR